MITRVDRLVRKFNAGVDFDYLYSKDVAEKFCVLLALKYAIGHDNRLSRPELVRRTAAIWRRKIDGKTPPPRERKIRQIVHDLRRHGALILSTGGKKGGYWITDNFEEGLIFAERELEARGKDLLTTASVIKKSLQRRFGGQQKMNL